MRFCKPEEGTWKLRVMPGSAKDSQGDSEATARAHMLVCAGHVFCLSACVSVCVWKEAGKRYGRYSVLYLRQTISKSYNFLDRSFFFCFQIN